jgi:organic radical activating enzyme
VTFAIKEMFYSLHGECRNAGRPPFFCQFAGGDLWNGGERDIDTNTQAAMAYCLGHPQWRLSLQTHKFMSIS